VREERRRRRLDGHVSQGRLDAALVVLDSWQAESPRDIEPELLRARVELLGGRYVAARARFLAAVRERAVPPSLATEVVEGLRLFVAHDALAHWARTYPHRAALAPADQARTAAALSAIGAHALARDWVDAAVTAAPGDGVCRVNRALIHQYAGAFDEARADLDHVLGTAQESAMGYWLQSRLRRQTADANHVAVLHERLQRPLDPRDRELLLHALFKELDDLGDTDAAWEALSAACASARARAPYDRARHERLFALLKHPMGAPDAALHAQTATTPDAALSAPPTTTPASAPRRGERIPIFIVGLHRSGTTLLESMLGAHAGVHAYGESPRLTAALRHAADHYCPTLIDEPLARRLPQLDYERVREQFMAEGHHAIGSATHVTEKRPDNFQLVGIIHRAMPDAKVLHLRRDPMDVCFANLRENFPEAVAHANDMDDLAHYHGLYRDLMAHWHAAFPGFVLDVDYEDLVTDPLETSRRVFDFCGLPWDDGVVDPARWQARSINTLSSVQARSRVNRGSVGRWRAYARWLEPLRRGLGA
jgi:tetratricopeptide (TPR) repeat protein